jgi:hypothetical protein
VLTQETTDVGLTLIAPEAVVMDGVGSAGDRNIGQRSFQSGGHYSVCGTLAPTIIDTHPRHVDGFQVLWLLPTKLTGD